MKKILFLTNFRNGNREEDDYLIEKLKGTFELIVSHPLECEKYLPEIEGIIIRNIWPTHEYKEELERILSVITKLKIPTYNPLSGKGDRQGKNYLLSLYQQEFPVIPSVDHIEDLDMLPDSEYYWIKPKSGCDGFGAEKLTKEALLKREFKDYIIQPFIEFTSEPSFYYLDNKFLYAIEMPNRLAGTNIKIHEPTKEDLTFAQKFVDWNALPYGIQRIDAVRTQTGELLLTEVEDIAEYLYLLDIDENKREQIVEKLIHSLCLSL